MCPHRSRQSSRGFAARLWWSLFFLNKRLRNSEEMEALDAKQFHWEIYIHSLKWGATRFPNIKYDTRVNQTTLVNHPKKVKLANFSEETSVRVILLSQKMEMLYGAIFEWFSWCLRSGTMIELSQFNNYNHSFFKRLEFFSVTRLRNIKLIAAFDLFS